MAAPRLLQRFLAYRAGVASAAFVAILALIAVGTFVAPGLDPHQISDAAMVPPSIEHLFGTDELGRDMLLGILYGSQVSLAVGLSAAIGATLLGVLLGAAAGFYGGWVRPAGLGHSGKFPGVGGV